MKAMGIFRSIAFRHTTALLDFLMVGCCLWMGIVSWFASIDLDTAFPLQCVLIQAGTRSALLLATVAIGGNGGTHASCTCRM